MPERLLAGNAKNDFAAWMSNIVKSDGPGFCTRYFMLYGGMKSLKVRLEFLIDDWKQVTAPLGLADVADLMHVKRNLNDSQTRTALQVPPRILNKLKALDSEIYEHYC
jgi:hypothetical protein